MLRALQSTQASRNRSAPLETEEVGRKLKAEGHLVNYGLERASAVLSEQQDAANLGKKSHLRTALMLG